MKNEKIDWKSILVGSFAIIFVLGTAFMILTKEKANTSEQPINLTTCLEELQHYEWGENNIPPLALCIGIIIGIAIGGVGVGLYCNGKIK